MKSVVLTNNRSLRLEERDIPVPDFDECRVRIAAAGVCSSDIWRGFENGAYSYPLVMGHELSGIIDEIGKGVKKNLGVGDQVAIFPLIPCFKCYFCKNRRYAQCRDYSYYGSRQDGGFSEYLNVKEWNLVQLPRSKVSLIDAATLEPLAVVVHTLRTANLLPDQRNKFKCSGHIAIVGTGFMGQIAISILTLYHPDLSISAFDRNANKIDMLSSRRVEGLIVQDDRAWISYLGDNSDSFDTVLEFTGNPKLVCHSIQLCRPGGNIILVGNISGDLRIPQNLVSSILRKELHIKGIWNSTYDTRLHDDWDRSIELISEGVRPSEFISKLIKLDDLSVGLLHLHEQKVNRHPHGIVKLMVQNE